MIDAPTIVREALKKSVYEKNYRFRVMKKETPTELDFEIDNENLVAESVQIDEKMCSGDTLEFGLCEGSTLEFQYFGLPNITGHGVWAFIDCQYRDTDGILKWYAIPLGRFDVKECSRQSSTGIIKATCYNKLLSDYLDEKANDKIEELSSDGMDNDKITPYAITSALLKDFGVSKYEITEIKTHTSLPYQPPKPTPSQVIARFPLNNEINFKLNGDTTTYMLGVQLGYITPATGVTLDPEKRTVFSGVDEFVELIRDVKKKIAEFAYANVQSPQAFLDALFVNNLGYIDCFGLQAFKEISDTEPPNPNYVYVVDPQKTVSGAITVRDLTTLTSLMNITKFRLNFTFGLVARNVNTGMKQIWYYESEEYDYEKREKIAENFKVGQMDKDELDDIQMSKTDIPDVTLRQLQSAMFEIYCQFGKLDRVTDLFSGVTLNGDRLLPSDTLYPSDDLKPRSISEHTAKAMYSKLWADEGNVKSFRYLNITYKGLDEQGKEIEKTMQRTVNTHGTDDYNMSDNWLLKNLVWTENQIIEYSDIMIARMKNITWFPFEMWSAGLPYLETGDELEISLGGESYTSYILQKQTKGIQNLQDTCINGTLNIF